MRGYVCIDGVDGHRPDMKHTDYFESRLLERDIRLEWCQYVVDHPLDHTVQEDGRIRYWGLVPETGKFLRVVLLEDGETFHNAFWDAAFRRRMIR
jgi:hypothetical protein